MPNFDIVREVKPKKTFRVASVMGTFDLETENIIEHFKGNIALPNEWSVGLIVGITKTRNQHHSIEWLFLLNTEGNNGKKQWRYEKL